MADDDAPSPAGGFSLSKKYGPLPAWAWGLLGGAVIYAGFKFYESRKASASTNSSTSASDYGGIDYAPQIATLQEEIQQLQGRASTSSTTSTTPTTSSTTPTTSSSTPTSNGAKTMPNLVGELANFAIGELKSGYGVKATTVPVRNPRNEYKVTGQTPKAGAKVRAGMPAVLRVKVSKAAK